MFPSKLDGEQAALPFPRPQIWWIYKAGRGPGRASKLERPSVPRTPGAISEATSEVSRFSSSRLRLGRLRCVTSDFGAVGWQQGTRPPPPQAGCSLCHGKTPTHPAPTTRVISAPQECEPQSNDRGVCGVRRSAGDSQPGAFSLRRLQLLTATEQSAQAGT